MASKSSDGKEHIESQLEFSGTFTEGVFAKIGPRLNEIASFVLGRHFRGFLETIGKDYRGCGVLERDKRQRWISVRCRGRF